MQKRGAASDVFSLATDSGWMSKAWTGLHIFGVHICVKWFIKFNGFKHVCPAPLPVGTVLVDEEGKPTILQTRFGATEEVTKLCPVA